MPGWNTPITHLKAYSDLPKEARDYIEVREPGFSCLGSGVRVSSADLKKKTVHRNLRWGQGETELGLSFHNSLTPMITLTISNRSSGLGPDRTARI